MGDTNVKIKLTGDTSQLRREIKMIDRELNELGKNTSRPQSSTQRDSHSSSSESTTPRDSITPDEKNRQENLNKYASELSKELQLVRKELQNMNRNNNFPQGATGTSSTPTSSGSSSSTSSSSSGLPSGSGGGGDSGKKLTDAVGKLASMAVVLKGLSNAKNYVTQGARASASAESQAYATYGSTLAYTDYYTAKKDAYNMGLQYGYSQDEVMNANKAYMSSGAGFTTTEQNQFDMNTLLSTSKATGIDTGELASASGGMSARGLNAHEFSTILANGIAEGSMQGRESEMLKVVEGIFDTLSQGKITVTGDNVSDTLGIYSMLTSGNDNLKGQAGLEAITSMDSAIRSGGGARDVMMGLGTTDTGLAGVLDIKKKNAQGLTSDNLKTIMGNLNKFSGGNKDVMELGLIDQYGLTPDVAEEYLSHYDEIMNGTYKSNDLKDEKKADKYIGDRTENYNNAKVSKQERYEIQKQDAKEGAGNVLNNITSPLKNFYNGLPTGARIGLDAVLGTGKLVGATKGISYAKNLPGKLMSDVKGGSSKLAFGDKVDDLIDAYNNGGDVEGALGKLSKNGKVTEAMRDWGDDLVDIANKGGDTTEMVAKGYSKFGRKTKLSSLVPKKFLANSGDDIANVIANSGDDVVKAGTKIIAESGDDVLRAGTKGLSAGTKGLGKALGPIGIALSAGLTWKDLKESKTQSKKNGAIGEFVGGMAGGAGGGAVAGAAVGSVVPGAGTAIGAGIGAIIGAITGGFAGKKIGESTGKKKDEELERIKSQGLIDATDENKKSTDQLQKSVDKLEKTMSRVNRYGLTGTTTKTSSGTRTTYGDPEETTADYYYNNRYKQHAVGNDYVPYDNYLASLHKGEMVLTQYEADNYRQGKSNKVGGSVGGSSSIDLNININGSVEGMSNENKQQIVNAVVQQINNSSLTGLLSTSFQRIPNM